MMSINFADDLNNLLKVLISISNMINNQVQNKKGPSSVASRGSTKKYAASNNLGK